MKNNLLYIIPMLLLFITSCSDDDDNILDTEKPTVTINEPEEGEVFEVGGELHFDILLSDNQMLASYKVDIHNNFDGHTHSGIIKADNNLTRQQTDVAPWSYNETFEIEGNQTTFEAHEHIAIPDNVAEGNYHLGITVIDAAGNQEQAYVQFAIGHDHDHGDDDDHDDDHGITITDLEVGDATRGSDIHAEAQMTAPNGIANVSVNIHGHGLDPLEGEQAWVFDAEFDSYSGTSAEFHEHVDIPENAAPGEYHMTITVVDGEGHTHAEGGNFIVYAEENTSITVTDFHISEEATAGADIHAEAIVAAEEGLSEIHVHIHSESDEEWGLEQTFTYEGETSLEFHEHIDIPADTPAGEYHLEMEIIDQAENTLTESGHFNVVEQD